MTTVACLLKKEGFRVIFYCYDKADFYASTLEEAGIPIAWELEPTHYLRRMLKVRSFIRNGDFDAVVSFLPACNFLNDFAAIGKHKWKAITGERSSRKSTFTSRRGKFFGWLQKYSDYIVCNSQNACDLWQHYHPEYTDKLRVIYNSVQLGTIHSEYEPKTAGKLHIIVAATYQYLKNPLGLVKALSQMNDDERSRIVIEWYGRIEMSRGDTKAYDDTVKAIKQNNLESVLVLHPDTNDIADKMYQADVVMLLSEFEGLPNAICEAMSMGKPIIMTRVSDYDVLVDENNGFLCDWNSPESIKASILSMEQLTLEQLQTMGKASKAKASKLFSEFVITQNWETVIN